MILRSPDCRDGKHPACTGTGWDETADAPAPCPCLCHATLLDVDPPLEVEELRAFGSADPVATISGPGSGFPVVAGRCPSCRGASLFLAAGGHVTCARLDCPDPCAADTALEGTVTP